MILFRGPRYWQFEVRGLLCVSWWYAGYEHTPRHYRLHIHVLTALFGIRPRMRAFPMGDSA